MDQDAVRALAQRLAPDGREPGLDRLGEPALRCEALAEPLEVFHKFYMGDKPFIGGDKPSIADIRLASTLEFLAVINYPVPAWVKSYTAAMEKALGSAYAEPAADVRGYIAYVQSQKQ